MLLAVVGTGLGVAAATPNAGMADTSTAEIDITGDGPELATLGNDYGATDAEVDPTLSDDTGETTVILSVDRGIELSEATNVGPLLQANSDATLGPVASEVESLGAATVQNRITLGNLLVVDINLDVHSVDELASIDGVERVTPNIRFTVPDPVAPTDVTTGAGVAGNDVSTAQNHNFTFGLQQLDIPGFEEEFNGERGGNATVAVVDNGFSNPEEGHPDIEIAKKYLIQDGNVTEGIIAPGSHGEHVSGTATGAADPVGDVPRYGVAPNATLVKLDVFGTDPTATSADILTALNISAFDENADVAGFSLGADPTDPNADALYQPVYTSVIADANAAGMAASISSGNAGLGAVGSPGSDFLSMSVGAANSAGDIAGFSSGGVISDASIQQFDGEPTVQLPEFFPQKYVKPDVSAAGVDVLSAGPLGSAVPDENATYSLSSGTSMAQPHVAGAIALLQSLTAEQLPPREIQTALAETAEKPDLDGVTELNGRDTRYGTGIINVTAAALALQNTQTIEGTVTAPNGEAVVGATVGTDAGGLTTARGPDGSYTLYTTQDPANLTVDAFGSVPETVEVSGGQTTNVTLDPALAVELVEGQPIFETFGGEFNVSVNLANLENLTVGLTANSTVAPGDLTLLLNGQEQPIGEQISLGGFDGLATLTLDVADSTNLSEGDVVGLEHTFEGAGDSLTVETGPTQLTETLDPAAFQAEDFVGLPNAAPLNGVLSGYGADMTVTNTGQQPGVVQFDWFFGPLSLQSPPSSEVGPTRTFTESFNLVDLPPANFFDEPQVIAHGFQANNTETGVVDDFVAEQFTIFNGQDSEFTVPVFQPPAAAPAGATVTLPALVENIGALNDTQSIEFRFAGTTVASQNLTLDALSEVEPGNFTFDSQQIAFEGLTLPNDPGTYEHGIFTADNSQTRNITLVGPEALDIAGQGSEATVSGGNNDVSVDVVSASAVEGATVTLTIGGQQLTQTVNLSAGQTTVTFENATTGVSPGVYDVTVSALGAQTTGTVTVTLDTTGDGNPATDTNGDGNFDDVDGDGNADIVDVQALFDSLDNGELQSGAELFDFAGLSDNRVSVFDVQALFNEVTS